MQREPDCGVVIERPLFPLVRACPLDHVGGEFEVFQRYQRSLAEPEQLLFVAPECPGFFLPARLPLAECELRSGPRHAFSIRLLTASPEAFVFPVADSPRVENFVAVPLVGLSRETRRFLLARLSLLRVHGRNGL